MNTFIGDVMKMIFHETKNGLPKKDRTESVMMLSKTLASTTDLYLQLKHAHWNIKGKEFIALHKLFDEIAEEIEDQVDVIAERITALGGTAFGTVQEVAKNTELRVFPTNVFYMEDVLEHLTHNFAILSELAREDIDHSDEIDDMATNDLYIDLVRTLDKNLWFLEAHLQGK